MYTMTPIRSVREWSLLAVCLGLSVNTVALSAERCLWLRMVGISLCRLSNNPPHPCLAHGMPSTEGNRYGFEGGCVLKLDNAYHLFVSEMVDDPFWVKMKLAHWSSPDGRKWNRLSTLMESSGNYDGTDPRAAAVGHPCRYTASKTSGGICFMWPIGARGPIRPTGG